MPKQKIYPEQNRRIILKGIGASPGKVQGEAKIVNFPEEIYRINKKEIIVASFLTPEFITSVKKNSQILGIITDKGGLTCHAAIVTRELNIPYIAGTIYATKKLKDNMIITMDAKKGVIYGQINTF